MKNKLTKTHRTKVDYNIRKLGLTSGVLLLASLGLYLPLNQQLHNDNAVLNQQIEMLLTQHEQFEHEVIVLDSKLQILITELQR